MLQREGRLDTAESMRILTAVCAAIDAAHREGVLHRDLKPENILLPGGGAAGQGARLRRRQARGRRSPKERDDGGTEAQTALTAAGMIVGTPAYMAPEQFHAVEADARTDVFSLGVIAYEMLSGELPFGRGTLADVVLAQARGVPPMPPDLVSAGRRARHPLGARRRSGSPPADAAGVRDDAVSSAR